MSTMPPHLPLLSQLPNDLGKLKGSHGISIDRYSGACTLNGGITVPTGAVLSLLCAGHVTVARTFDSRYVVCITDAGRAWLEEWSVTEPYPMSAVTQGEE
ncbi:hypothetical protein CTI14_39465 [Methylobacterium radiotolerans]|nr:hypothetical protein CTI14_39465 [Methylobacterium radiotolerans]